MKYKLVDLHSKGIGLYDRWWWLTITLKWYPGFWGRLFGKKPYIRTYYSTTGEIWDCLETHTTHFDIYPSSLASKLKSMQKCAPQHFERLKKEKQLLADKFLEEEKIKEEKVLQDRLKRSRFENIF